MTDQHEKRIRRAIVYAASLSVIAAVTPLILSLLRPVTQDVDTWLQRSGAVMTVFAVFSQYKADGLLEMMRGGAFAESWSMHRKYAVIQTAISYVSVGLIIVGTVIWGYGDLFVRYATSAK